MPTVSFPFSPFAGLPRNFWSPPNKRTQGEADERLLYEAIGRSLSNWEMVETMVAGLFSILIESQSEAPMRAYGSIVSGAGRAGMLRTALEAFFRWNGSIDEDIKSTTFLVNNYQNAAALRNQIAHGIVMEYDIDGTKHGFLLTAPEYNTKKTHPSHYWEPGTIRTSSEYAYISEDVNIISNKFVEFIECIRSHNGYLTNEYIFKKLSSTPQR